MTAKPAKPATVDEYLASLPPDRREALQAVRDVVRANLDPAYGEGIQYGMIGWFVPHSVYPAGYHCDPRQPLPFAGLASQKNHMSLYLMCIYGSPEQEAWFRAAWAKTGKRLDMGKSCVRFKRVDDLALDVIGEAVRRSPAKAVIEHYEATIRPGTRKTAGSGKRAASEGARSATGGTAEQPARPVARVARPSAQRVAKTPAKKPAKKPGKRSAR